MGDLSGVELVFVLAADNHDIGDCEGVYKRDSESMSWLNGQPVYINAVKNKFLGWAIDSWVITDTAYFNDIMALQGRFSGIHSNVGSAEPQMGWAKYNVTVDSTGFEGILCDTWEQNKKYICVC
jgi:hypothetical protein